MSTDMILIFDLDDTLYEEELYALSGFKVVARQMSKKYNIPSNDAYSVMRSALKSGNRNQAFQKLVLKWDLPQKAVNECLGLYRNHDPSIKLDSVTKKALSNFEHTNKYVVTDGNKIVQKRKVDALKLEEIFNKCFITHNFGIKAAKPSTICFEKIKEIESVTWKDLVYVGDDPNKDFVNLKPLGVLTIRVLTGRYSQLEVSPDFDADIRIPNLAFLADALHLRYEK